jgi:hypothetical protein
MNHELQCKSKSVPGPIYLSVEVFRIFVEIVRSRLTIFIFCIFPTGNVMAQEEEPVSATDSISSSKKFNQAINMCPGGIAFGIFSFNYEHLFSQTHGLVCRFDYESVSESYNDDSIKANGFAIILNYRWHWSGAMESGYLGSYVRYRNYKGTGTSGLTEFDFTMPELTLGLNIGKRWVWNSGFNINFALGYGISTYSMETDPSNASNESTLTKFVDEYTFFGPFLGEFSLGYAF